MQDEFEYDITVTFAGEDRAFVEEVIDRVKRANVRVFYDQDQQVEHWGEDLTEYFPRVYERQSRYAVMFVSKEYAAKPWTRLERRSILVRALEQEDPYLLPVRLDDTELPGVRSTISYLDGRQLGPKGISDAICTKLGTVHTKHDLKIWHVPRTEREALALVGERPPAWEYLLFSYELVKNLEKLNDKYLDFSAGFALPTEFIEADLVVRTVGVEQAKMLGMVDTLERILVSPLQRLALGSPGVPGDPDRIVHLANRIIAVYREFIEWAARLRSFVAQSSEAIRLFQTLSRFADQPIDRVRSFVYDLRLFADGVFERIANGENVELQMVLKLEIHQKVLDDFSRALNNYERGAS